MPSDTKRTKMIHIYAPAGGEARIEFERETRRRYENGDEWTLPAGGRNVRRNVTNLSSAPLPGGPVTVRTWADLMVLLDSCGDSLAKSDEDRESAEAAARAAAAKGGTP